MSTCNIRIQRAEQGPVAAGSVMKGNILLDVHGDVHADGIVLHMGWYTHGKGNRKSEDLESLTFPGGEWHAGRQVSVPFQVRVPAEAPVTYRGHLINLDWRLRVSVDLPHKRDAEVEEDFVVVAGPRTTPPGPKAPLDQAQKMALLTKDPRAFGCGALALLVPFSFGLVTLVRGLNEPNPGTIVFGAVIVVLAGGAAATLLLRYFAHRSVGNSELVLQTSRVSPGQELSAHIDLPRRVTERLAGVTFELVGREEAVSGGGTRSSTHRHEIARIPLSVDRKDRGTFIRFQSGGRVPESTVPTLTVPDNRVMWAVQAKAQLRGRPDPEWSQDLEVMPGLVAKEETL